MLQVLGFLFVFVSQGKINSVKFTANNNLKCVFPQKLWTSCEVQDSLVQTAVREKWELQWFHDIIIFCLVHISVSLCHRDICFLQQSCLITSAVAYQRSSWDVLRLSTSLSLSLMFVLLPLTLISHHSCLLLSTPNPFIRLSTLTYQSFFPVLSHPIPLCPWHSFLLLPSQYFTLYP